MPPREGALCTGIPLRGVTIKLTWLCLTGVLQVSWTATRRRRWECRLNGDDDGIALRETFFGFVERRLIWTTPTYRRRSSHLSRDWANEEKIVKSPHNQIKDLLFIGLIIHPNPPWIFSLFHCSMVTHPGLSRTREAASPRTACGAESFGQPAQQRGMGFGAL